MHPQKLPSRKAAMESLKIAIASCSANTHSGKWSLDETGRDFITLTWTCGPAKKPASAPKHSAWGLYGGKEILTEAGLWSDRYVDGMDDHGRLFSTALIYVLG